MKTTRVPGVLVLALAVTIGAAGASMTGGARASVRAATDECPILSESGARAAMEVQGTAAQQATFRMNAQHVLLSFRKCTFTVDDALGPRSMTVYRTDFGKALKFLKSRTKANCMAVRTFCPAAEKVAEADDPIQALQIVLHELANYGSPARLTGFGGNPAYSWSAGPGSPLLGTLVFVYVTKHKGELLSEDERRLIEVFCYRLNKPAKESKFPECAEHAAHQIYLESTS